MRDDLLEGMTQATRKARVWLELPVDELTPSLELTRRAIWQLLVALECIVADEHDR